MSVVRGRPPGLAGGIIGASRAYCSSPRACPAPKSPTSARLSAVHMACLREGLLPSRTADATAPPHARLDGASFSNGLLAWLCTSGWPAGDEHEAVEQVGWDFLHLSAARRGSESHRCPQLAPDQGEGVAESGIVFRVPADAVR